MAECPVSVVILTKNEARRIADTLATLKGFNDVWVVDSQSDDQTVDLARAAGASVESFVWNGQYPKKKQWALDHLPLKYDWVLLLDADERLTPALCDEIAALFADGRAPNMDGYFIRGFYRIGDQILRHGQQNHKLMLMNRQKLTFPVLDDLAFDGGWEVEGHYQPVAREGVAKVGCLDAALIHDAFDDVDALKKRHINYAKWEALMNLHQAWPLDVVPKRQRLKQIFRALPCRAVVMFLYCYVVKGGVLDGRLGLAFALQRAVYYKDIAKFQRAFKRGAS